MTRRVPLARIAAATVLAAAAATVANLVLRALAIELFDIPSAFEPLELRAVIVSTLGGVAAAGVAFVIVARFARDPVRIYAMLAAVALVASLWAPLQLGLADPPENPGTNAESVGTLMAMHFVSAAIAVPALIAAWRRSAFSAA